MYLTDRSSNLSNVHLLSRALRKGSPKMYPFAMAHWVLFAKTSRKDGPQRTGRSIDIAYYRKIRLHLKIPNKGDWFLSFILSKPYFCVPWLCLPLLLSAQIRKKTSLFSSSLLSPLLKRVHKNKKVIFTRVKSSSSNSRRRSLYLWVNI